MVDLEVVEWWENKKMKMQKDEGFLQKVVKNKNAVAEFAKVNTHFFIPI